MFIALVILGCLVLVYLFTSSKDIVKTTKNQQKTKIEEKHTKENIEVDSVEKEVINVQYEISKDETILDELNNTKEILLISEVDKLNLFELQFLSRKKIDLPTKHNAFFEIIINEDYKLYLKLSVDIVTEFDDMLVKVIDVKDNKTFTFDPYLFGHIREDIFYEVSIDTSEGTCFVDEKEDLTMFKNLDTKEYTTPNNQDNFLKFLIHL